MPVLAVTYRLKHTYNHVRSSLTISGLRAISCAHRIGAMSPLGARNFRRICPSRATASCPVDDGSQALTRAILSSA